MIDLRNVETVPRTFKEDGFLSEYPMETGTNYGFCGYLGAMVDLALRNDDPEAFIYFMRKACLDRTTTTLDNLSMESYCDKRTAKKCKRALGKLKPNASPCATPSLKSTEERHG
jgi:hypothetical protein